MNRTIYATTRVAHDNGQSVTLELYQDHDGRYRWYSGDTATEVSGDSVSEAIEAGWEKWQEWELG